MRKIDRSMIESALGPVYAHIAEPAKNDDDQNVEYIGITANASIYNGRLGTLVHSLNLLARAGLLYDPDYPDVAPQRPSLEMTDAFLHKNGQGVSVLDMVFRDHNFRENANVSE